MSDEVRYYEGVGRRKRAIARVRLYPGDGQIVVNEKPLKEHFGRAQDWMAVAAPLKLTSTEASYNVSALVSGGA